MSIQTSFRPAIVFGEILFDVFPGRRCLGGAPFNFAFHLHCLGVPVLFISRVGADKAGREILGFFQKFDFPADGLQIDPDHPTGEVRVTLDSGGIPEFDIVPDRAYDYIQLDESIASRFSGDNPLIYFGTLVQRNRISRQTLHAILKTRGAGAFVMMDLNLRPPFYDRDVVESSMDHCDLLKLAREELEEIGRLLGISGPPGETAASLQKKYGIGLVCVTHGADGSELYEAGSSPSHTAPACEVESVVDTVGAGDAFSAMLAASLLAGNPPHTLLPRAARFAARVCGIPGALPDDRNFYRPFQIDP